MKKTSKFSFNTLVWQTATLGALITIFTSPLISTLQSFGLRRGIPVPTAVSTVEAKEIYPMFTCPCCGNPLDTENICCDSAAQMIDYIDQQVSTGAKKDDVVLATVQEFGLERLKDESDRKLLREKLLANSPKDAPKIKSVEVKKDLGIVNLHKGTITTNFTIKNQGRSDLIIDKLSSSCGCTSASLVYQGKEGPRFYMAGHGYESPDANWQVAIAPGDEAQVKVYYDPSVHPNLTGPVTREVSVHSNDPVDFETKLTIYLDQEK